MFSLHVRFHLQCLAQAILFLCFSLITLTDLTSTIGHKFVEGIYQQLQINRIVRREKTSENQRRCKFGEVIGQHGDWKRREYCVSLCCRYQRMVQLIHSRSCKARELRERSGEQFTMNMWTWKLKSHNRPKQFSLLLLQRRVDCDSIYSSYLVVQDDAAYKQQSKLPLEDLGHWISRTASSPWPLGLLDLL